MPLGLRMVLPTAFEYSTEWDFGLRVSVTFEEEARLVESSLRVFGNLAEQTCRATVVLGEVRVAEVFSAA